MRRVLSVDRRNEQITVEAGIRLNELNERLAAEGLALSSLGSYSQQSLAGALATGTHGSGARFGVIAKNAVGFRLVTPAGKILDINDKDAELLSAVRVSVGALGIVTAVTLRCEAAFNLSSEMELLPFDEALARMDEIVDSNDHVKFWWLPYTQQMRVFRINRTAEQPSRKRFPSPFTIAQGALNGRHHVAGLLPLVIPTLNRATAKCFRTHRRVDRSDRVFVLPTPVHHQEMEYAFDRTLAPTIIRQLRRLIEGKGLAVTCNVEVRFVAADDIMLSPAFGRSSCFLGALTCSDEKSYFAGYEELMADAEGRPHWGKVFSLPASVLRARYPKFDRFNEIRQEFDPLRTLENAFIARVFGASSSQAGQRPRLTGE
jgi:L-gulonolactone oxidase